MHRFQRLAVGLTRTDTDAGLLEYAAMVARLGTATEVGFVHVPSGVWDDEGLADELRAAAAKPFAGIAPEVKQTFDVLPGPLLDRLLAYISERKTDLLFLGHRRDHPGRWALARRLAMKAGCSVWMVPEGASPRIRRILVPIDFSEHAADTLRVATGLAARLGLTECLALHVYFNEARSTYDEYDAVIRGNEDEAFRSFIGRVDRQGVRVLPVFEEGANVAHVVNRVAEARGCDVVVMASRGRSRSASILLGSVTEDAIAETRVPLLVVKHYGAQLGFLRALWDKTFKAERGPQFD